MIGKFQNLGSVRKMACEFKWTK